MLSNDVTRHGPAVNYVPAGIQLIIISALDRSATERLQYLLIPSPYVRSLALAVTVTYWARNSEFLYSMGIIQLVWR